MQQLTDQTIQAGDGLLLRPLGAGDIPLVARACQDPLTQQWLPLPRPYTEQAARDFVETIASQQLASGNGIERAIERSGEFVGVIGAKKTDWAARKTEVGYWLAPWARGKGVMTRALCAMTDWLLGTQQITRVEVHVAPGNAASLAVARRAGFVREGIMRRAGHTHDGTTDLVLFSRLADDPRP
ncbi:GNAT family N-acetyltransferase [Luteococcus sp. OSA5]|uniref:GNAT family N-acetyltransferase n=1 Tax=Luteococcus sp. OSA5 TaxID=3401630 RepID=UPI003B4314EF